MKIEEVKSVTRAQRVAAHSHVKSLGLNEGLKKIQISKKIQLFIKKEMRLKLPAAWSVRKRRVKRAD